MDGANPDLSIDNSKTEAPGIFHLYQCIYHRRLQLPPKVTKTETAMN